MMEKPATDAIDRIVDALHRITRHPWRIMEICGGQTHAIARYGIEKLLPPQITLIHGPGCPVCVTPETTVEKAMQIAGRSDVVFTTFGDMLRVPGISGDLLSLKSRGADIRMLYSPLDALPIAKALPGKEVVFLAVGFETTVPVYASAILSAQRQKITNFSLLTSLYTVPPAIEAIMADDECRIDGLLAAGHVCTVEGYGRYEELARRLGVSISVTGFTPVELLLGIYHDIRLLENGEHDVYNAYPAAVSRHGNRKAKEAVDVRNRAESLIFQSEKTLNELGEKADPADVQAVRDAIAKLQETLKAGSTEAIKADTEAVEKAFYKVSEKLYAQQQGNAGGAQGGADAGNGGQAGSDGTYYNANFEDHSES